MSRRYNTDDRYNDSRKDDRYGRDDYYWHDDYDVNTEDADAPNPSKHKANGEGDPNRLKRARHPRKPHLQERLGRKTLMVKRLPPSSVT